MAQQVFKYLQYYNLDPRSINRLIVSTFLQINEIKVANNILLIEHTITQKDTEEYEALMKFSSIILKEKSSFTIEDIIELFEYVISPANKEVNGAVYTSSHIRSYIINNIIKNIPNDNIIEMKFADISCGCGGFFYTLAQSIKNKCNLSFYDIFKNNIYGVDIENYSIERTKLLLILLAVQNGEDIRRFDWNLYVANSLEFDWNGNDEIRQHGGFDAVIGNPPYVGSSKIDSKSRKFLKNWSVSKTGKSDLYIPFFQIGIECLRPNGILGYITVSNFYRSLNGRGIRQYFSENRYPLNIIDFGSEQVFRGRSTYTCLCFISKQPNGEVKYTKSTSSDIFSIKDSDYIHIQYDDLSNHNGWLLQKPKISANIRKIETTGISLGTYFDIRNGFATLKNSVFLFTVDYEDDTYYYFSKEGNNYFVEKGICRDAIKPNTLKKESEIQSKREKLIFPYFSECGLFDTLTNVKIIEEKHFFKNYPKAYEYLSLFKNILKERDKRKKTYEAWYAFGRNQALNINGYKLLFPYLSDKAYFVYTEQRDLLFYNGYALISENKEDLIIAQKVLCSKVFWYYIKYTSKPYGGNYFSLAKNYVKNFGFYQFNEEQKRELCNLENKKSIDSFLMKLYDINI